MSNDQFDGSLPESLKPSVREAVLARLKGGETMENVDALIRAATFDDEIRSLVEQAASGDNDAFDDLYGHVREKILRVIRIKLRCRRIEHVPEVETVVLLEMRRLITPMDPEAEGEGFHFDRTKGFFLTWSRSIAANHARWHKCEPLRAAPPGPEPVDESRFLLPPSQCYREMLDFIQESPPHQALAFLFHGFLEWKPADVEEELGDVELGELARKAEILIGDLRPPVRPALSLEMTRSKCQKGETLRTHAPDGLAAAIGHWSFSVGRANSNRVMSGARDLPAIVCGIRETKTHERVVFLRCDLAAESPVRLCALQQTDLVELLDGFVALHTRRTGFEVYKADTATLRRELLDTPGKTLSECFLSSAAAAIADRIWEMGTWRAKVRLQLLDPARGRHVSAYCYLAGALPGVRTPRLKLRKSAPGRVPDQARLQEGGRE